MTLTAVTAVAACGLWIAGSADAMGRANLPGVWKVHPAADINTGVPGSQVSKIFVTPTHTFYVMRGRGYEKRAMSGATINSNLELNYLFRSANAERGRGVYPASDDLDMSSESLQLVQYSPAADVLAVAYDNGMIDLIKGEEVTPLSLLRDNLIPDSHKVNSMTFSADGKQLFLATVRGYWVIDVASTEVICHRVCEGEMAYVAPLGNRYVAIATAPDILVEASTGEPTDAKYTTNLPAIYLFEKGGVPDFDHPTPVNMASAVSGTWYSETSRSVASPQTMMSLSDSSVMITALSGSSAAVVALYPSQGDELKGEQLFLSATNAELGADLKYCHNYQFESIVSPYKDGVAVNANTQIMLIPTGVEPSETDTYDSLLTGAGMTTIQKSNFGSDKVANEQYRIVGSHDGHEFTFLHTKEGFYTRRAEYGDGVAATWSARSETMPVHGNACGLTTSFGYHPEYGMLMRGNHKDEVNTPLGSQNDNLSAYRDGTWTYMSHYKEFPTAAIRMNGAFGAAYDPLNPDWVYSTCFNTAFIRQNLKDAKDLLLLGRVGFNSMKSIPGYIEAFPKESYVLSDLVNFSVPRFDNNNVLWTAKGDPDSNKEKLFYWKPEDRLAASNAVNDHEAYLQHPMQCITVTGVDVRHRNRLEVFRTPGHENLLYMSFRGNLNKTYSPYVYDHNGTLEDTSDDRMVRLRDVPVEGQKPFNYEYVSYGSVDPQTGEIWMLSERGAFYITPEELFSDAPMMHQLLFEDQERGFNPTATEGTRFIFIDFDPSGRKWLASENGVICISADKKEVLGYWNSSNSPLPYDRVEGLGIDPVTGDIWVGTLRGLAQFSPAGAVSAGKSGDVVSVTPERIEPHYNGHIFISGLSDADSYDIVDSEGNVVSALQGSVHGLTQWHPVDARGKELPTGLYHVRDAEGSVKADIHIVK